MERSKKKSEMNKKREKRFLKILKEPWKRGQTDFLKAVTERWPAHPDVFYKIILPQKWNGLQAQEEKGENRTDG